MKTQLVYLNDIIVYKSYKFEDSTVIESNALSDDEVKKLYQFTNGGK